MVLAGPFKFLEVGLTIFFSEGAFGTFSFVYHGESLIRTQSERPRDMSDELHPAAIKALIAFKSHRKEVNILLFGESNGTSV